MGQILARLVRAIDVSREIGEARLVFAKILFSRVRSEFYGDSELSSGGVYMMGGARGIRFPPIKKYRNAEY